MAPIDRRLLERLTEKLGVGVSQVYSLIAKKAQQDSLGRDVAAIALANERGINTSKFASPEQLAEIRHARAGRAPGTGTSTVAPVRTVPNPRPAKAAKKPAPGPANSVFVVHGRNLKARDELFKFLRALGLKPIEWTKAIKLTGEAAPYIGTILDKAFGNAAAIVVLLTPDDEAKLRRKYQREHDPSYERKLTGQARANVLFEAGMAFGRNPTKTVLAQLGSIRPFSDVGGRHVVQLSNTHESRKELSTKLRNAGCAVDEDGTAWLSEGDFKL